MSRKVKVQKSARVKVTWGPKQAEALSAARATFGVTRKRLAELCQVSEARIRELEVLRAWGRTGEGAVRPSPGLKERLDAALNELASQAPAPAGDPEKPKRAAKPRAKRAGKGKAQAEPVAAEPDAVTAQVLNDDDEAALTA